MNASRYHTLWPRFCAGFIDMVVVLPFLVAFFVLELPVLSWAGWSLGLTMVAVNTTYYVIMHARSGQTIGKRTMKVRVADSETEKRITLRQSLWRESPLIVINVIFFVVELVIILTGAERAAASLVSAYIVIQRLPNLWAISDAATSLFNSKRRTLHDFIGRTVVINCSETPHAVEPLPKTLAPADAPNLRMPQ